MAGAAPLARPGHGPHANTAQFSMRTAIISPCDIRAASIEIQQPMPKAAVADGRPGQAPKGVHGADLPIIDELGCLPADVEGARLPCQVMAATYESRSMIVTTDAGSGRRGTVPGDDEPATAAVDRVARHGRLVESGGNSRRFDEALMMGKSER